MPSPIATALTALIDMLAAALAGKEPGELDGAESLEVFMTNADMERLNFYRELSSAFRSIGPGRQRTARELSEL